MKKLSRISAVTILIVIVSVIPFSQADAASVGSASCSISPASASMPQSSSLGFTATSDHPSTSGDYVYVTAREFSNGVYSDLNVGKVIPVGANSLDFRVYAQNTAETGSKTFKVYCSTGCPYGGCPGGGSADILGSATVNLVVTGTNTSGGSSSTGSCSIPNVVLPPNSSTLVKFGFPTGNYINGSVGLSGSSNSDISATPMSPNITIQGGRWNGAGEVVVQTGPSFSGGTYSVTSNISGVKCTATGTASLPVVTNASGKIKITQVKSLNNVMFPDSGCIEYNMGTGCRQKFSGGSGPKIVNYLGQLALLGGDLMRSTFSRITPSVFSLTDPINPMFAKSGVVTVSDDSVKGEHGMTTATAVAVSKDGKYSAVSTNYGLLIVGTPSKSKTIIDGDYESGINNLNIVNIGSTYVLLSERNTLNITNPTAWTYGSEPSPEPLPNNFPNLNTGSKMVLGDGSYIAVDTNSSSEINLFSLNKEEPIAKLSIPAGHEKINFSSYTATKIPFSGGDYIFTWGTSGVNLFKFEYANPKITWVIKDVSYADYTNKYGNFFSNSIAGFDAGNGNNGIITFGATAIRAFLFSDIALGKWTNTLVSSPLVASEQGTLDSFSKNGITYVYTGGDGTNVKVWKIEANTDSGDVTYVPPVGGGVITTNTVDPIIYAGCPNGNVFQTSAGLMCVDSSDGVTTTTTFDFDKRTYQKGCLGGVAYNIVSGEKCIEGVNVLKAIPPKTNIPPRPTTPPIFETPSTMSSLGLYNLGDMILKQGSSGEAVKELQRFLNDKLNLGLIVDGKLGPKTILVVKKWQSDNGLVSDGLVGAKTKAMMNAQ